MARKASNVRTIDQDLIDEVCASLREGKRLRQALPFDGRLHIERQLPFLFIYRDPVGKHDAETERLITAEAAFLITSANASQRKRVASLVHQVVETMATEFGGFLIFEVWAGEEVEKDENCDPEAVRPAFTIHTDQSSDDECMERVYESLRDGLKRIKVMGKSAEVAMNYTRKTTPPRIPVLIPSRGMEMLNCYAIGLEVQPIWRNPNRGDDFPMVLRTLHRHISRALKRACFTFTLNKTQHRPKHYLALGRQAVTRSLWDVDRRLAEVSSSFDFLLNLTPINSVKAWNAFKRNGFERRPVFHYRPIAIDPSELKRQLYSIDIDRIEDPTLDLIFREKRVEIDRQLTLLTDRNTAAFRFGSMQLYGKVEDTLFEHAKAILDRFPGRSGDDTSQGKVTVEDFARRSQSELENMRQQLPELEAKVIVTSEVVGLMVSRGRLMLNANLKIPANRVRALIAHEVGVHVLTYWNARSQPLKLLASGLAGYDEFQEGFAVLSEYLTGGLTRARLRLLAGRVVAARYLEDGATFIETFRRLSRNHDFDQRTAYQISMRIFRGGGLTKDHVYLRGLISILDYFKKGGDIEPLLMGKIARRHIPIIRELHHRKVLNPPAIHPSFLKSELALQNLAKVTKGIELADLISPSSAVRRKKAVA